MVTLAGSVKSILIRENLKLFIEIPIPEELSDKEKFDLKTRIHCGPALLNQNEKSLKAEITSVVSVNRGKIISIAAEMGKRYAQSFNLGPIEIEYLVPEPGNNRV